MPNIIMKIFFLNFKKQAFVSHKRKTSNPHYHWTILLRVFGFIGLCLFAFSIYLLFKIKNDQIFQLSNTTSPKTISVNEKSLKKVIEIFEIKKVTFEKIKTSPSVYQDLSL